MPYDWTPERLARLAAMWIAGDKTLDISRELCVSKNVVVGKVHRMGLTARPSPIRPANSGTPRARGPRERKIGLPPLVSLTPVAEEPGQTRCAAPAPVPIVHFARSKPCCWPIGEPGTASFRFCESDGLPGRVYCEEHAAIAYVRIRDRREDVRR